MRKSKNRYGGFIFMPFISAAMAQVFRPEAMRQELFSDTYLHVTTRPRGSGDVILKRGRGRAQLLRTDPTR